MYQPDYKAIEQAVLNRLKAQFMNIAFKVTAEFEQRGFFTFVKIVVTADGLTRSLSFSNPFSNPTTWPAWCHAREVAKVLAPFIPIQNHKRQCLMHTLKTELHRAYPWVELEVGTEINEIGSEAFVRASIRPYECQESFSAQFLLQESIPEMVRQFVRMFPSTNWGSMPGVDQARVALKSKVKAAYFDQDYKVEVTPSSIGVYFVEITIKDEIDEEQVVKLYFDNTRPLEHVISHTLEVLARYVNQ